MEVLAEEVWRARRTAHERRVDELDHAAPRTAAARREAPVEDFLFDYYSYRPGQLRRWHPGAGVTLSGESAHEYLRQPGYVETPDGITLDVDAFLARRGDTVRWVHDLLRRTAERPATSAVSACTSGRWSKAASRRRTAQRLATTSHAREAGRDRRGARRPVQPLRRVPFLHRAGAAANVLRPARETQHELEQGGCLHANMDLYKWAYKLRRSLRPS